MRIIHHALLFALLLFVAAGCGQQSSSENDSEPPEVQVANYRTGSDQQGPVATKLNERRAESKAKMPGEVMSVFASHREELEKSNLVENALKVGDKLPPFELSNAFGNNVASDELLKNGPLVLVYYRGSWCPYCNVHLQSIQESLPEIRAAGGTIVAITPEYPDESMTTVETHSLEYEVLSDPGLALARQLGLVFELTPQVDSAFAGFGLNLREHNKSDKSELPIPATYVVNSYGEIVYAFLDVDYTYRAEPSEVIEALNKI